MKTVRTLSGSFNLAIENLIFSRKGICIRSTMTGVIVSISQSRILSFQADKFVNTVWVCEFQSRNRESYLFKLSSTRRWVRASKFQSRNRESYLFKDFAETGINDKSCRFNLAIENLIFSSAVCRDPTAACHQVSISQSRILSFQGRTS